MVSPVPVVGHIDCAINIDGLSGGRAVLLLLDRVIEYVSVVSVELLIRHVRELVDTLFVGGVRV